MSEANDGTQLGNSTPINKPTDETPASNPTTTQGATAGQCSVNVTFRNNVDALRQRVRINRIQHSLAERYFAFNSFWMFTMPQAILTAVSSILGFLATIEEDCNDKVSTYSLGVGIIAAVALLIQTLGGLKGYSKKADRHGNIRDDLDAIEAQLEYALSSKHDEQEKEIEETFRVLQKKLVRMRPSSNVPIEISECFEGLKSNFDVALTEKNIAVLKSRYGEDVDVMVWYTRKAIPIVEGEILSYWLFPWYLPDPKTIVAKTMYSLHKQDLEANNPSSFFDDED